MITQVSYERVFNLGNYENHRISATASVENDEYHVAFAAARSAVEEQHALFIAEREAEQERKRAEWDQKRQAQLALIRQRNDEDLSL